MAKNKFLEANEKIADGVVSGYKKIETGVVEGYKKIEDGVVSGYKKVEQGAVSGFEKTTDFFGEKLFTREGETVEDAKARLRGEEKDQ